ncbi:DNA polymerase III subunit delta [Campylobacter mucosalis]|uniref:DNA polymerase III, delta subunit n=1 Tax=Campylobacter mucosalis CCUG 21559 TaxID=1032067 RepID=A0A6G5QHU6_9BACT|nr:DNA polymerase III subunit delta [Campylobacter mucosalis]QCD45265.1 DNA polymerase III, delta subunit [Campylobacter mucosalis CCUG 21559]
MYRRELENNLISNKISNHFLLFGADEYQIELFAKEILAIYVNQDSNLMSMYFDEYDFETAKSHLSENSLFGGDNVLHIKNDKRIPAKELKELVGLSIKDSSKKILFEFYEADMKNILDAQKIFGQNFARFFKPSTPDEAVDLLSRSASKIGLNITRNALYELFFIHNENLYLAASELQKLSSLNTHIDQDMIRQLVFGLGGVSFDDFFNKLVSLKDIRGDFFIYEQDLNFNEILLINSLYKAFFRLFKLHSYVKINGRFDVKQTLGYAPPKNIEDALKKQSLSLKIQTYTDIFVALNLAEFELKTNSKLQKSIYLLSTLLNLQNIISTANIK